MSAPWLNGGMELYGHHDQSKRSCINMHQMARFNGTYMTNWMPLRHHMNNIEQVLFDFLNKPNHKLTASQMVGYNLLRGYLNHDVTTFPEKIVIALNAIFFGNLLNNRLHVSLVDMRGDEGQTRFFDLNIPRTAAAVIEIHNFRSRDDDYYYYRPQERRLRVISTLIHEMCHSFLMIYGCDGRECATKQEVMYGRGFCGHGPAWQRIANAAEQIFIQRIVPMMPGVEYDEDEPLGIPAAIRHEARERRYFN